MKIKLFQPSHIIKMSSDTIACMVVEVNGILPTSRAMNTREMQPLQGICTIFVVHIFVHGKNLGCTEVFYICSIHGIFSHFRTIEISRSCTSIFAVVRSYFINVVTYKLSYFHVPCFPSSDSHTQSSEEAVSISFNFVHSRKMCPQILANLGCRNIIFAQNQRDPFAYSFPVRQQEGNEFEWIPRFLSFNNSYFITSIMRGRGI